MINRIDRALVELGLTKTRSNAQDAILDNRVRVNGKTVTKCAYEVCESDFIELIPASVTYASRGGFKLEHALDTFQLSVEGKTVLDIGASTGGFSDVCLQRNAKKVYAVDVGHDQLSEMLKNDPRVINLEKTNALDLTREQLEPITFLCMDVSFVSIQALIPHLISLCADDCDYVVLIKPQFEATKKDIGKKGIVKDSKVHLMVLEKTLAFLDSLQLGVHHLTYSTLTGREGNQEYLVHFSKQRSQRVFNLKNIIKEAKKTD